MRPFLFGNIAWKETAILNFIRSIAASLVWLLVSLLMFDTFVPALLSLPFQYLLILAPIGIVCSYLSRIFPSIGFATTVLALFIVVGDPVIALIKHLKPNLIPVDRYPVFNFVLIIYVLKN